MTSTHQFSQVRLKLAMAKMMTAMKKVGSDTFIDGLTAD
jgi:hypothetical protein